MRLRAAVRMQDSEQACGLHERFEQDCREKRSGSRHCPLCPLLSLQHARSNCWTGGTWPQRQLPPGLEEKRHQSVSWYNSFTFNTHARIELELAHQASTWLSNLTLPLLSLFLSVPLNPPPPPPYLSPNNPLVSSSPLQPAHSDPFPDTFACRPSRQGDPWAERCTL